MQISTVTNVVDNQTALQDSKTTIKQGNNIRTLTYITIAYLPLGFITVRSRAPDTFSAEISWLILGMEGSFFHPARDVHGQREWRFICVISCYILPRDLFPSLPLGDGLVEVPGPQMAKHPTS
jgi:hypothetical protein